MKHRLPQVIAEVNTSGLKKLDQTWYMTLFDDDITDDTIRIGIDEVGRGCVFGPVVVAGVAILNNWHINGIKDSKMIKSEVKRRGLSSEIQHNCLWCTASVSAENMNKLYDAWKEGTERPMTFALRICFEKIEAHLVERVKPIIGKRKLEVVCDGTDMQSKDFGHYSRRCEPKADATVYEVSAASIVAKVLRDNWCHEIVKSEPNLAIYGIDQNKGYGSVQHRNALRKHGLTKHHRNLACATLLTE